MVVQTDYNWAVVGIHLGNTELVEEVGNSAVDFECHHLGACNLEICSLEVCNPD